MTTEDKEREKDKSQTAARKKAPSRQAHACPVCGIIYSRAEFVRRHYASKHAPKPLVCTSCDATFSRRDLLQRHVKLFHPDSTMPLPAESAALEPEIPAPVPVPSRSASAASYASSSTTSDLTGGASGGALFGNWISSSPEPMAGGVMLPPDDMRLPTPPPPPLGGAGRDLSSSLLSHRTATYPPPRVPYQPYHAPSLPPPSLPHTPILRGYPSHSQSPFPMLAGAHSSSSSAFPSVPYRAYTAPAGYDPAAALHLAGLGPFPRAPSSSASLSTGGLPSRQASYSDASVQTDLRAQHVIGPPGLTSSGPPHMHGLVGDAGAPPLMSEDALAALLQRMAPPLGTGHESPSVHSPHLQHLQTTGMLPPPSHLYAQAPTQHGAPGQTQLHHTSLLRHPPTSYAQPLQDGAQEMETSLHSFDPTCHPPPPPPSTTISMAALHAHAHAFGLGLGSGGGGSGGGMPYPLRPPPVRPRQASGQQQASPGTSPGTEAAAASAAAAA